MKRFLQCSMGWGLLLFSSACGGALSTSSGPSSGSTPGGGLGQDYPEGSFVVAEARIRIEADPGLEVQDQIRISRSGLLRTGDVPVSVSVKSDSRFALDASDFFLPTTLTPEPLSFGSLFLSDYFSNDLRVCGSSGRTKCGRLQIRLYTDGSGGAGFYNEADSYGVPVYANLRGSENGVELGWGRAQSLILQEVVIPTSKNVLRLRDFAEEPRYDLSVDFSNAGVGSYQTEIVVESILVL